MQKFTFQKIIGTTGFASLISGTTEIRLGGLTCGYICKTTEDFYKVHFMVKDGDSYSWLRTKKKSKLEKSMLKWVRENNDIIQNDVELYFLDD